jgi:hypothetical protein
MRGRHSIRGAAAVVIALVSLAGPGAGSAFAGDEVVRNCANDVQLRAALQRMQASNGGTLGFDCGSAAIVLNGTDGHRVKGIAPDTPRSTGTAASERHGVARPAGFEPAT